MGCVRGSNPEPSPANHYNYSARMLLCNNCSMLGNRSCMHKRKDEEVWGTTLPSHSCPCSWQYAKAVCCNEPKCIAKEGSTKWQKWAKQRARDIYQEESREFTKTLQKVCTGTSVGGLSGSLAVREQSCHWTPSLLGNTNTSFRQAPACSRPSSSATPSQIYLQAHEKMSAR